MSSRAPRAVERPSAFASRSSSYRTSATPFHQFLARQGEHPVEHRLRQSAGKRVLLAWMVRGKKAQAAQFVQSSMSEPRHRVVGNPSQGTISPEGIFESDLPKPHHDPDFLEKPELLEEKGGAACQLCRQGFVSRRCAAKSGSNVAVV
jgi:hypothetical protein